MGINAEVLLENLMADAPVLAATATTLGAPALGAGILAVELLLEALRAAATTVTGSLEDTRASIDAETEARIRARFGQ